VMSLSVKTLLVLCALACVFGAQNRVDINTLDPFTPDTDPLIILVDTTALPQTLTGSTTDSGIVGGERDLILTVTSGDDNSIVTAGVSDGDWSISTPNAAAGFSVMQYDGVDGSGTLVQNGLNLDLTAGGADSLHTFIQTDIATTYTFTLYSASGTSTTVLDIPGNDQLGEYFIKYSDFTGGATLTAIGAIEIRVEALVNVDTFMTIIATAGPVAASASAPAPPPSASVVPSAEPSCACKCPVFHCGVVFATPGDDDDSVDDDTHDDDEFVYRPVYYFPEDDNFEDILGDDDDNEFISFEGFLTTANPHADDLQRDQLYLSSKNASSSLAVPLFLISVIALLI